MDIWKILGLEKTKDKDKIRDAYRSRLVVTNPEDDQQAFIELREAYEKATQYAACASENDENDGNGQDAGNEQRAENGQNTDNRQGTGNEGKVESRKNKFDDTPIGQWLARVDCVYQDIGKRKNPECWRELLEEDICFSLDTKTAVRDSLLRYLMDHNFLPQEVWKLLDDRFLLQEYKNELYENFPTDYINRGVIDNIRYREFIDFDRLESRGGDQYDEYLLLCNRAYNYATAGKTDEVRDCIGQMDELLLYHPYRDICEARYLAVEQEFDRAEALMTGLLKQYPKDRQVLRYTGVIYALEKQYDKAIENYQKILEEEPDYYEVNFELGEVYFAAERYKEAKKCYDKAFDIHKTNYIGQKISDCVEKLSEQYEKAYKEEPDDTQKVIRYAKSCYQLLKTAEAMSLLMKVKITPDVDEKVWVEYQHIMGCCYIYNEEYEKAMPYLERWIQGTENLHNDGSEEASYLAEGLVYAYLYTAYTICELGKSEEEIQVFLDKALATGLNRIDVYEYQARILFIRKQYERVMEVSEDIFTCDASSVEAHIFRAQALYEMGYIRDAIEEFDAAIRIEPYDLKLYMEKVKCFMRIDEYDEAGKVLQYLKENGVEYEEIDMQEAVIAAEKGNADESIKVLERLIEAEEKKVLERMAQTLPFSEEKDGKQKKNKFLSRLYYEAGILYHRQGEEEKAFNYIEKAELFHPQSEDVLYTKAMLLKRRREYDKAIACLKKLSEEKPYHLSVNARLGEIYGNLQEYEKEITYYTKQLKIMPDARIYYNRAEAFTNLNRLEEAIRDYSKCIELDADGELAIYAYTGIGDAWVFDEQEERGIEQYLAALAKCEQDPKLYIYNLLATAYSRLGQKEKALEYAREYRARTKDHRSDFVRIFEVCGQYEEAIEGYRLCIEAAKRRNVAGSFYRECDKICKCSILLGRIQDAQKTIEEIYTGSEDMRNWADLWKLEFYHMVICLRKNDQKAKGRGGLLGGYFKKDHTKTDLRILMDYYLNRELRSEDGWDLLLLRFLFELRDSDNGKIRLNHPNMVPVVKKQQKELLALEADLVRKEEPYLLVRKAVICMEQGDFEKALAWLEEAEKRKKCRYCKFTKCSEALFTKAVLFEMMGRKTEAVKYYQETVNIDQADVMFQTEWERIRNDSIQG